MPFRTKTGYSTPSGGYVKRGKSGVAKSYSGPGPPPAGTKKVPEKTISEVPVVTTSPSGHVTTGGFSSQKAASGARHKQKAAIRTERRKTRALNLTRRSAAQQRRKTSQSGASLKHTEKRIQADRKVKPAPTPKLVPTSKPPVFQGKKTAGTPSLKELQVASKQGKLKTNQRGYLTTPAVRKTVAKVKGLESKAVASRSPLPGLTPQASQTARKVLARGAKAGATRKEKLAAAETGLVESGFENLPGGDADSEGWRQERASLYPNPRNVKASASRFFQEAKTDTGGARGRGQTAGQLAQTIQGSAYPERYDERKPEANAILKAYERGSLKPAQRKKLQAAKAEASRLGLKGLTKGKQVGPAPKKVVTRYKAARVAMKEIEGTPYVWGGGHGVPGGLDCSGAISYVLDKAGVLKGSLTSGAMGSVLKPGPGAITVFYNADHTFLYDAVKKEFWGTSVGDSGSGGLGPHPAPSAAYLAQYSVGHVPGLGRKQALQLGGNAVVPTSFPGMSLSSSGTTATIESGAGTTNSGKPGFSSKPIRLTRAQKARRTFKRLEQVGVGESQPAEEAPSETLKSLESRYGVKT